MDNKYHEKLIVSSAPHAVGPISTQKIMTLVLVALIPAFVVGIYQPSMLHFFLMSKTPFPSMEVYL